MLESLITNRNSRLGIVVTYGHVSMLEKVDPGTYLLSMSLRMTIVDKYMFVSLEIFGSEKSTLCGRTKHDTLKFCLYLSLIPGIYRYYHYLLPPEREL